MKAITKTVMEVQFTPEETSALDKTFEICDKLIGSMNEHSCGQMIEDRHLDVIDYEQLKSVKEFIVNLKAGKYWNLS